MLTYDEVRVLRAVGDFIKARNNPNTLFECNRFKSHFLTIIVSPNKIKNVLDKFESIGFIEFSEKYDDLDRCIITMTKNGFHEYLKHSVRLMDIYRKIAPILSKGVFNSSEISKNIGQKEVIVTTILQEWNDLGYVNLLSHGLHVEIESITSQGQRFINTLCSNYPKFLFRGL